MGLKKNIFYSSILTTSNYIFPLLVYPYVSRVLGVSNIGICNFVDSIIHYFILFSMMGITIMGTREIAAEKNNIHSLDSRFSSLIALNGITTIVAVIILIIVTLKVPKLWENREMMLYGGVKLISNFLLIEWFYKGIEKFRFITLRTIVIKCLYVISVFIFIKDIDDYPTYYLLTCLMITVNAIINYIYSRKYVSFNFDLINLKYIAKPFFILGSYMLITSMCTTFNVAYLGFVTDDTQVGYYTTATKLYTILLALFTGVTSVIMPRMSSLLANNKYNEFENLLTKSTSILFAFSVPVIILSIIFAPEIILLISGKGYEGAITPMRIVMPLMLVIGYEQIIVIQGLMPLRQDKTIMINSSIGAIVSLVLNIALVSKFASIGSSIVWLCAETVILILSQIALTKIISIKFPLKQLLRDIISYIPLIAILLLFQKLTKNEEFWIVIIISSIIVGMYTLICQLYIVKNSIIMDFVKNIRQKKL